MALVATETAHPLEWLLFEIHPDMSRDTYTLINGQTLLSGTVIGVITASGKITAHAPAAADGSQNAMGILYTDAKAVGADKTNVVVVTGNAVAHASRIIWNGSITAPQKTTALAALRAKNLFVR